MTRGELAKLLQPSADWVAPARQRRRGKPPEPTVVWVEGQKCRLVELTRGFKALIDEADMKTVCKNHWFVTRRGYAVRMARVDGIRIVLYMHVVIYGRQMVDHWNRFKCDNRRSNLRPCTQSQNIGNSSPQVREKSSLFKGVTWNRHTKKWSAAIKCNGKRHRIYYGGSEIEAAKAYDAAALELFGEFSCINFPTEEGVPVAV